jgi:hypothetical protein
MVSLRELLSKIDHIQEASVMKYAVTPGQPQEKVSDDIGHEFLSKLAHAKESIQAEILSILFDLNWEDPHTPEEIAAAYVSSETKDHTNIDNLLDYHDDFNDAMQPHNDN